jgi:hypothetical protein
MATHQITPTIIDQFKAIVGAQFILTDAENINKMIPNLPLNILKG